MGVMGVCITSHFPIVYKVLHHWEGGGVGETIMLQLGFFINLFAAQRKI
jgi:hypothetical protein